MGIDSGIVSVSATEGLTSFEFIPPITRSDFDNLPVPEGGLQGGKIHKWGPSVVSADLQGRILRVNHLSAAFFGDPEILASYAERIATQLGYSVVHEVVSVD